MNIAIAAATLCAGLLMTATGDVQDKRKPLVVPFELLSTRHILVEVKVNGKGPFNLIFDTGAPVTLISGRVAKEGQVISKKHRRPLFSPFGSMGDFRIAKLEIGPVIAKDVPAIVMNHPTVELMGRMLGRRIDGIVGLSFFGQYRFSVDYKSKTLTFVPNGYDPPDMMKQLLKSMLGARSKAKVVILRSAAPLGFDVAKKGGDDAPGVDVVAVVKGSPAADAGLQAGDRLLSLDDHWTDTVVDCYRAAASMQPNGLVEVAIERNGKRLVLRIKLKPGI